MYFLWQSSGISGVTSLEGAQQTMSTSFFLLFSQHCAIVLLDSLRQDVDESHCQKYTAGDAIHETEGELRASAVLGVSRDQPDVNDHQHNANECDFHM